MIRNGRMKLEDVYKASLEEHWSRCCFCGKHNGLFGKPLEQHHPRCRWKGDASAFNVLIPNYYQMIDEDDKIYLPMMRAQEELRQAQKRIKQLEKLLGLPEL